MQKITSLISLMRAQGIDLHLVDNGRLNITSRTGRDFKKYLPTITARKAEIIELLEGEQLMAEFEELEPDWKRWAEEWIATLVECTNH